MIVQYDSITIILLLFAGAYSFIQTKTFSFNSLRFSISFYNQHLYMNFMKSCSNIQMTSSYLTKRFFYKGIKWHFPNIKS